MNHLGEIDSYFTEEDTYDRYLRLRREQRAARIARDPEKYKDKRKREKRNRPHVPLVGAAAARKKKYNEAYRERNRAVLLVKQRAYNQRKRAEARGQKTPI